MSAAHPFPRPGIKSTTDAAIEVAAHVATHLKELAGTGQDAPDRESKLREFCRRFAEHAFRRPLTDEQKSFFIDRQFKEAKNPEMAVKRVILLVLKSPRFLYREIGSSGPDGLTWRPASPSDSGTRSPTSRCSMRPLPVSSAPANKSSARLSAWWVICRARRNSASYSCNGSRSTRCPTSPRTRSSIRSSTR